MSRWVLNGANLWPEHNPSLLTIVLDTNPAAWAVLSDTLPLAKAVADLLVFINAHLACNYTNKVGVIASHCDKAQWLYPTPTEQKLPRHAPKASQKRSEDVASFRDQLAESTKRMKLSSSQAEQNGSHKSKSESNKYRPFRLVEEELVQNLENLLLSTSPDVVSSHSSTMVAGALTLALSYINRETVLHNESVTGAAPNLADSSTTQAATSEGAGNNALTNSLQSRIFLLSLSPSTDLAHQYIPIMNSIFACQRLNIPIDVLQLPLSSPTPAENPDSSLSTSVATSPTTTANSTVFLQQAADATHGIFVSAILQSSDTASSSLLTYLLTAFLPSPNTRTHLVPPTRIDVDFRAACFCHRNVISTGFVCSICLSIFCSVPDNGDCLTCGTHLMLGDYGGRPVVVPRRKKKKTRKVGGGGGPDGSRMGTPVPA